MASRKDFMCYIVFVPYPMFSDDKNIYLKFDMLLCKGMTNEVIGKASAILTRATLTEKAHFSYYDYYLYDEKLLDMLDDNHKEQALASCDDIVEVIWG